MQALCGLLLLVSGDLVTFAFGFADPVVDFDATDWIASEVTHALNDQDYITSAVLEVQM